MAEQRVALFPLIVAYPGTLFGNHICTGAKIWVKGEALVSHAWAKELFEIEPDKKFVLVPEEMVFMICNNAEDNEKAIKENVNQNTTLKQEYVGS